MKGQSTAYGIMVLGLAVGLLITVYGVFQDVMESFILLGGFIALLCVSWLALQAGSLEPQHGH